jgi:heterotetrameric sarcosine oxidase gamma subunit
MKIDLPNNNLQIKINENLLCSKNSFDQWNIISLKEMINSFESQINELNKNGEILVTDFSEGQSYFEISGDNKSDALTQTLNKISHFDFREKMFPNLTSAQTLIARVDCAIYNLGSRFLITCNRSFGKYLEERFIDAIKY